jgi:NAD-dependent dihydropyrimidine dehydrogenase PreA subunit
MEAEMIKEDQVYRDLQAHLDKLPVGFPAAKSGVEIRILKHLFTPEEAEIALQLSMIPQTVESIYKRIKKSGMSIEQLQKKLDHMVYKGSIRGGKEGDKKVYGNLQLAVGMYEHQVDRLTRDFAEDVVQYFDAEFGDEMGKTKIPQLRTIPVEKSIPIPEKYQVSNYDNVRYLIESARGQIAVANCVCRQVKDLVGESCRTTDLRETCLITSQRSADYYVDAGIGRYITKEEALQILERAQEAGLVLQPNNAEHAAAICCCCGDCCGLLTGMKRFPRPADYYASNFYSEVDADLCTGCQACVDICQLDAAVMNDGVAFINPDRCIGCGNCVVVCELNAIQLKKKDAEHVPPKKISDLYTKILLKKMSA